MAAQPVLRAPPAGLRLLATALGAMALLSGCMATNGYGGYPPGGQYPNTGQYPHYPQQPYPGPGAGQVVGTVLSMDPRGRLLLSADNSGYGGGYGSGARVEVMFDQRTRLVYQGRVEPVTGLEPGDVVRVEVATSGGRPYARHIELLQDVRGGSGQYGNQLGGAVAFVDPRARVIEFTRGGYSGVPERVRYDERTQVEYRGRLYRPENLERGDVIRIQARRWGNEWLAERILVETSVRERY